MSSKAAKTTNYWFIIHSGIIKAGHCVIAHKTGDYKKNEDLTRLSLYEST